MMNSATRPVAATTTQNRAPAEFEPHSLRGRFNSAFFWVMGGYINGQMRKRKAKVFAGLPSAVVELGSGVGANLRYLPAGARLIAIEPNPYMHTRLRRAARRRGVELEIRSVAGERIDLPDDSAEAVISSLVLCSVRDPAAVLAEVRRILQPGGRFSFAEHVAAKEHTPTRWSQRILRRPWAWVFEGCSCERDLAAVIESAGFTSVDIDHYRIRSAFLPFNTHIAGTAVAGDAEGGPTRTRHQPEPADAARPIAVSSVRVVPDQPFYLSGSSCVV